MALCDRCGAQKSAERACQTCGSYENQLGEQVRNFEDTFSVFTVLKEEFFPSLLTDAEKAQLAERDRKRHETYEQNMKEMEAWQRLRRHLELENTRWTEHDTGRQEREQDMKLVDEAMQVYETVQEIH